MVSVVRGKFLFFSVLFVLLASAVWAGGKKDQIETITVDGAEIWSHEFDISERKPGPYNFIIHAQDTAGNEAVSGPFNLHIDPSAGLPAVRIIYPENNMIIRDNINLLGVASGYYGVERVLIRLGDLDDGVVADGAEYWNKLVDLTGVPDGKYTFFVQAFDDKGFSGPVQSIDFTLDRAPPEILLSSHGIGDIITGNTKIKGTADDLNGIQSMEFSTDGVTFSPLSVKRRRDSTAVEFNFSINTKKLMPKDGSLVYYLRAVDTTGLAIVKPFLFFVTNSGPELEVYTPVKGEDVYETLFLSGRAYHTIGLSKLYYEWGKVKTDIELRPGDPYWNVTLELGPKPPKNIKVVAVDIAGNVTSVTSKVEDRRKVKAPAYNAALTRPEIQIIAPAFENPAYGSKTVMGVVDLTAPVQTIAYALDGVNFTPLDFASRYDKAWFSYFCDFTALSANNGRLVFRVTDSTGSYDMACNYDFEPNPPIPTIIVNSPDDGQTITSAFEISGLAYYDIDINAVYWRLQGASQEEIPFRELSTSRDFLIPVDFTMVTNGEYTLEIYATDIYGLQSETVSRTIRVSTALPVTRIVSPVTTDYNRKAIKVQGTSIDANGIKEVSLSMDNGNTWQNTVVQADGTWEVVLNSANYADGSYSVLIRTTDGYDVMALSTAMINIDNTPPELYISAPVDGQYVGTDMLLTGQVLDNVALKSLSVQLINATNSSYRRTVELDPQMLISRRISLDGFPQGEYIVRVVAKDLADNETLVSRQIVYDADDTSAQVALFNPMPGEIHSGQINVVGRVTGVFRPQTVNIMMNDTRMDSAPVDRFSGIFSYTIPEEMLQEEKSFKVSVYYESQAGARITSPEHMVYYSPYGPILLIESHQDGDVITQRPWLTGRAWVALPEPAEGEAPLTRRQKAEYNVKEITVSHDNGRTFRRASGGSEWKFRMETSELHPGPQPVVVKAVFANGSEAIRRVLINVDTTLPQLETLAPQEDSFHRDNVLIYGTASDNAELANVAISLRPGDKFFYAVPGALQGLYFDIKGLGATYFDVGLGLSFFDNNVRLQAQFGLAPADGVESLFTSGGRYNGYVYGIKLMANIFYLPFDYLFGLDWAFFSMNFALGANFSYFTMDTLREPLFMGAIVGQWDIANIDMRHFYPNWRYCSNFALYLGPELWFASSDVQAATIFRLTVGLRVNFF